MSGPTEGDAGQVPAQFAALAAQAQAIDAGQVEGDTITAPPGAGQVVAAPAVDMAAANAQAVAFALAVLREASGVLWSPPLRKLQERMPDEVVERIAGPWGRAFASSGYDLGKYTGGPWMEALATTGPLLWGIARALLQELDARNGTKRRPAEVAPRADDPGRPE